MQNPIKEIYKYNKDRGLLDTGYSDLRECAYPIEEALEGMDITKLAAKLCSSSVDPKEVSRHIMSMTKPSSDLTNVARLDKHLDSIVFSLGSIFKMGLTPQEAMNALGIVAHANATKSTQVDEEGKNIKGDDWEAPEVKLQALLDKARLKSKE